MKTTFTILILIVSSLSLSGQNKCATAVISQRIDSICKANKISSCEVFFNYPTTFDGNSTGIAFRLMSSGVFKFDDCFLIVGDSDKCYFDLSKLVDFHFFFKNKYWGIDKLVISFQRI